MDYSKVVFFGTNRVWRLYTGGKLLGEFCGAKNSQDGYFPEDWLASATRACNGVHQQSEDEGLSFIVNDDGSRGANFRDYLRKNPQATLGQDEYDDGEGIGVLCKFLDSAIRLPIQCHPDVAFAKKHYNSNHGKAEAWMILGTREINGEVPYLLMGFKPGVTAAQFKVAVETQNIPAMENMLHKVPVKAGDMFFIPGKFPHAIGPGVFLLEVQEPTDWVVQPEKSLGDVTLSDSDMGGPGSAEVGLACFDYENASDAAKTLAKVGITPDVLQSNDDGRLLQVIDAARTGCFEIRKLELCGEFTLPGGRYVGIVTAGELEMRDSKDRAYKAKKGQSFFVPATNDKITYKAINGHADVFIAAKA